MNFHEFFDSVEGKELSLPVSSFRSSDQYRLSNEALFQLPLISMIVLLMAKDRRKPKVAEVGQLVGESIEASMIGFKGSAQHVGWSANLRVRTVNAITFLESASLIQVDNRKGRLAITDVGKKVVDRALSYDDDLAYNLSVIARSYRNVCVARQLDLEIE
ncbi:hypothetical protein [Halopseudomonas sabulinigri]